MLNKIITRVFLIILLVAALQFVSTMILARHLTKPEMGLYRLVISIVELGSMISVLGLDYSLVRFFSAPGVAFDRYDWKAFFRRYRVPMLVIITCVGLLAKFIYRFDWPVASFILILLVCLSSQNIFSSLLRADQRFILAIFSSRAYFVVFFLLLAALAIPGRITLPHTFTAYAAASAACGVALAVYCF